MKTKILLISLIYAFDQNSWMRTKKSLESYLEGILEVSSSSAIEILWNICGFCKEIGYWKEIHNILAKITKECQSDLRDIYLIRYDSNVGKSKMINDSYSLLYSSFLKDDEHFDRTFIFFADGDIIFEKKEKEKGKENILETSLEILKCDESIAVCAPNQKGDCRHHATIHQYEKEIKENGMRIGWSDYSNSIAGGCFMIRSFFMKFIKFKEFETSFGPEDTYFFKDLKKFFPLFKSVVILDAYIIHPKDTNKEYSSKKKEILLKYHEKKKKNGD